MSGKFIGERCQGVKLTLTDRKTFVPFQTAAALLLVLQRLYPDKLGLDKGSAFFDRLAGTPTFREMILKQMPVAAIMEESKKEVEQFQRTAPAKMLYH